MLCDVDLTRFAFVDTIDVTITRTRGGGGTMLTEAITLSLPTFYMGNKGDLKA